MNYNEALNYIFSLKTVSLNPSLQRISMALDLLGNPQNSLKAIHIAGTNGKGSVASSVSKILIENGNKVGLFISPYIIDFTERIQINGSYISKTDLCRLTEQVNSIQVSLATSGLEMGQFEFITAVALLYFKEQNCDYVVLETGLGGKYDATNVFPDPECTVITKISYDHTAILGNTLEQIAGEKAGIIKYGVPCVTCQQSNEAFNVINNTCVNLASPLYTVKKSDISNVSISLNGTDFIYKGKKYFTSLCGTHQAENAALAIETVKRVDENISTNIINSGLAGVKHPARLEIFGSNPPVIIDGAHNPDGAKSLAEFLRSIKFCGNIIFGGMKDKNLKEVAEILSPFAQKVITVTVEDNPRAQTAEELAAIFSTYNNVYVAKSYTEAICITNNTPTVICGSLYLAADMRKFFDKTI